MIKPDQKPNHNSVKKKEAEIMALSATGLGCVRISKIIGCSPSSVRRILSADYANRCKKCREVWLSQNYDASRNASEDWRKRNLAHRAKQHRDSHAKNPQRTAMYERKALENPRRRLAQNLRRRMREVLSGKSKSASSLSLLGASFENIKDHIESLFSPGMSWENYGPKTWHIDHIIPLAYFDLSKPEDQSKAFHFTNLQPMWAILNLKKHAKYAK